MAGLKTLVWNCAGLRASSALSHKKAFYFEKEHKNNFQIAFFIETHHKSIDDITPEILRYQNTHHIVQSPVSENETHAGIIGLISKDFDIVETSDLIQGRILNVKIKSRLDNTEHSISAVYFETNNKLSKEKVQNYIKKLREAKQDHPNNMILGDFNFIDHEKDKAKGLNNLDKIATNLWLPFLVDMDMLDPFREQNPKRKVWSFMGTGAAGNSRIDRLYVNTINMNTISKSQYILTPFAGHKILSFERTSLNERGKGYYKMNTSIIKDPKFREMVTETLTEIEELQTNDDILKWVTFLSTVRSKAMSYSRKKGAVKRNLKNALKNEMTEIEEKMIEQDDGMMVRYEYTKQMLKKMEEEEIEGYKMRIKFLPSFEKDEPDIAFFSKIEDKKKAKDMITQLAEERNTSIYTDNENIMRISTKFYKQLYTSDKVNEEKQDKLLSNIKTKINLRQKQILDALIELEELRVAIFQMQTEKSPGLDGVPVEFYQEYWEVIKHLYLAFINKVKIYAFPTGKNTSAIKLIYKKSGEIFLLVNYRPISLINVDVKILCKALANRLKTVLPTIIHASQTAVYGRKIDQTIHTIRDLIDLANKQDDTAAFIFLDQEKAFDRVNHKFLFKTMRGFGIGQNFINWIKMIYSNATSVLNINGFFSERIPLKRGIRQGCPLSALLYLLVIEVFATQLRVNPNIVGFSIEGEKIVSAHYLDDATIIIKQNRCFKEVVKEITEYEEATGARVNYGKTKGLWVGSWKNRRSSPMGIKWTSANVFNLGVYFGNDDPATATYQKIIPNLNKRLNYWKQFKLTQMGKSRIVEIYLASKLIYVSKFYPIPAHMHTKLQQDIFSYINYPHKVITIEQKEMWKTKAQGGIKLINVQIKSKVPKVKWLIDLITEEHLQLNLKIFKTLIGTQKGKISGKDLLFLSPSYIRKQLRTECKFYKEALLAMSGYDTLKGIKTVEDWDKEHIFYNPLFLNKEGKTIASTKYCEDRNIHIFEHLLQEKVKESRKQPFNKTIVNICNKILLCTSVKQEDIMTLNNGKNIKFNYVTEKVLYEEALMQIQRDHHSQGKWVLQLQSPIVWEEVWKNVHNVLSYNKAKNTIWEQIHLNFYTQYSYNKWHKTRDVCPLCQNVPGNIFHLISHCSTVNQLWQDIEPTLKKLHNIPVTTEEKAFGLTQKKASTAILLRNWLTYLMRQVISDMEKQAYYTSNVNTKRIQEKLQSKMTAEIFLNVHRYEKENRLSFYDDIITHGSVICKKTEDGEYKITELFI